MKTKKLLSLLLALMMMLSVVPMYASAAEKLTATANVESYPTLSYKTADGKMYYGQTLEEALIINDDEVVRDAAGNQVAGHFEFRKPEYIPTPGTDIKLDIIFVPDDEDAYTSFTKLRSSLVYTVEAVTLVPVDENDPVPVASEVEPGALLSTSVLSGGALTNPHNPNEPNLLDTKWIWSPSLNPASKTVVNASGYYTAQFAPAGYDVITVQVYVKVASAIPETEIVEFPTIPELTYNPNVTWADIDLTGGKAVIKGTNTKVEGTFAIKNLNAIPNPSKTEIDVVFTPANAEEALPYEFTIPVKVNALPISFGEDYKGTTIDDPFEVEVTYGEKVSEVLFQAKKHLNYPTPSVVGIEDANSLAENGKVYEVHVLNYSNSNYTGTYAYVKAIFKTTEITSAIKKSIGSGLNKFFIDCGNYSPQGTFTVYCNGEEIAEVKAGYSFDCEVYTDEGGTYEITAKYNPIENDYFIVSDASWSITVAPVRHIKVANTSSMPFTVNGNSGHTATIRTGDTIVMEYTMPEFAYWVIKDGNGKTVELDGIDVNEKKITFTMPDYDLKFSVKTPAQLEQEEAEANCDHFCHSDNQFLQIFWNIISFFMRLFGTEQYCECGAAHYDAPIFG